MILRKTKLAFLLVFCVGLQACLDEIKVQTRIEPNKLVVEGLLTNDPSNQILRLSLTKNFSNFTEIEPVKGAYVEIRSNKTYAVKMYPQANEIGLYSPKEINFAGNIGEEYSLYVKLLDGREFLTPSQVLLKPVEINALKSDFKTDPSFGFQIKLDFKDPAQTNNYYRWTGLGFYQRKSIGVPISFSGFCCNRCWVEKEDKGVNLFTDNLTNGNLIKDISVFFSPFYLLGQHLIQVNQFTISSQTYQYWRKFKEQTDRTGTIFDPIPAPIFGNLVNIKDPKDIALGYFEVSGISKKRLEINDETHGKEAVNFDNNLYVPNGDCMLAFPYSVYVGQKPFGW
jgi:Domain of unknown function (DUF4249)